MHPRGEIADAQALHASAGVEIELAGNAVEVPGVGPGDCLQHQHRVFDAAGHGAELIERPAERHRAGAGDAAVSGTQASDAAAHAGADDAATGFAADRKTY